MSIGQVVESPDVNGVAVKRNRLNTKAVRARKKGREKERSQFTWSRCFLNRLLNAPRNGAVNQNDRKRGETQGEILPGQEGESPNPPTGAQKDCFLCLV